MKRAVWLGAGSIATFIGCSDSVFIVPGPAPAPIQSEAGLIITRTSTSTSTPEPAFGDVVVQQSPPPPISGGTLTIAQDGRTAVAADPDRDAVYVVDLKAEELRLIVPVPAHSEPGRVAIEGNRAYVALRAADAVAVIDLTFGTLVTRPVCRAPRGITNGPDPGTVFVACAGGDLVTLDVDANVIRSCTHLDRDLRDVIAQPDGRVHVTTFRNAKMQVIDTTGAKPPSSDYSFGSLAWRAVAMPGGDIVVVSQQPSDKPPVPAIPAYYGVAATPGVKPGDCTAQSVMQTRLTIAGLGTVKLPTAVLPVDVAANDTTVAVIAAGNAFMPGRRQVYAMSVRSVLGQKNACVEAVHGTVPGQAVAAAFDGRGRLIVQTREPAALHIMADNNTAPVRAIELSHESRLDTGHAIFHSATGSFVACASCHAEGNDDGRVWDLDGAGPRRTPALNGTLAGTAPYHWLGDVSDIPALVDSVFVGRMSGPSLAPEQSDALQGWLFKLPAPAPVRERDEQSDLGAVIFEQRCSGCHSGELFTNNGTYDVGTGGSFQVPSLLGVGWRAPFLHDGCANTLEERFSPRCGANTHGGSGLTENSIANVSAYLETL
jgi:mono/diheme cytochrome c family protein